MVGEAAEAGEKRGQTALPDFLRTRWTTVRRGWRGGHAVAIRDEEIAGHWVYNHVVSKEDAYVE